MSQHNSMDSTSVVGTIGGTIFTVANVGSADLMKTAVLAVLGAMVSFFTTQQLKYWWPRIKGGLKRAWDYVLSK